MRKVGDSATGEYRKVIKWIGIIAFFAIVPPSFLKGAEVILAQGLPSSRSAAVAEFTDDLPLILLAFWSGAMGTIVAYVYERLHGGLKSQPIIYPMSRFLFGAPVMRHSHGGHSVGIDARPHAMGMTAAILFVEDDHTGMTDEAELLLDPVDCNLEGADRYARCLRRAQRKRIEVLDAFGAATDRFRLAQSTHDRIRDETAYLMNFDMLILRLHEVNGQIAGTAALIAIEDHGHAPSINPRAFMR